ncbi:Pkinase-domain-containing protein, partial [Dendrothele bispora CBS 962.96]
QIGNWKLGRTLGQGAHGRVRIARNAKTGQMAAIKIIPKTYLSSQSNDSFENSDLEADKHEIAMQREVVLLKLIDHPNIMRLYDVWDLPGELYLVLEYVQGGELFDYLCENGALSTSEALSYFQQIILAIDYCHRFNIAHRDLKPENILLDSDFNIKIADFGLAAFQSDQPLHSACGSPHYTAPEVLMGNGYDGIVADVWSCGIILYALLVGRLPFEAEELEDLLALICEGSFDIPSHIDPLARDLIIRMLETDVELRINLTEVQNHPFFLSRPLNTSALPALSLEQIARPLRTREDVDPELFRNLCTLWRGTSEMELLDSLTSSEQNWQKGVYHLL